MTLDPEAAFAALRDLTAGQEQRSWSSSAAPAFERLRRAWNEPNRSPQELAVLLRQALLFETARRDGSNASLVLARGSPLQSFDGWAEFDLAADPLDGGWLVSALRWRPDWVATPPDGLDGYASAERPRRFVDEAAVAGDPFLTSLGYPHYQSVGQRAAVRAALTTPPGGTLAVGLATGEGKSLIFQLVAKIDFSEPGGARDGGLTVVVTPTVALAIDHENSAVEKGFARPVAYRGGDDQSNASLIAAIEAGTQRLCIASPEAVCGPLRGSLARAAARGQLRALVVDEAHLIDGWGTGFRTEFQSLSGVRREWLGLSPEGAEPRTLLLSATLPAPTLSMLGTLFSGPGPYQDLTALRLRPEPDYWAIDCGSEPVRRDRVMEAVRHVPRPAILYVTRVADAEVWRDALRDGGFPNVCMVHGETPARQRDEVLKGWRTGDVDLVVATSAFGLGIDYRHVRSVIHACVPESLDRFYQEVGRGGRDGRTCLSLALHTPGDFHIARRISRALVISLERGLQRWTSMYEKRTGAPTSNDAYLLPLDVAPSEAPEDIDMRGERNSDWNARVLALMARAGLVELQGGPPPAPERRGPHEIVRILDGGHQRPEIWLSRVEPIRRGLATASDASLDLMRSCLNGGCPAPRLLDLYAAGAEAHACGRCSACRADPAAQRPQRPRVEPASPWAQPWWSLGSRIAALLDSGGRLLVWYEPDAADALRRRYGQLIVDLRREGFFSFTLVRPPPVLASETLRVLAREPVFLTQVERLTQRRLPPGPHVVVLGPDASVEMPDLRPPPATAPQLIVAPTRLADPARPGGLLSATFGGKTLSFDSFYARLHA